MNLRPGLLLLLTWPVVAQEAAPQRPRDARRAANDMLAGLDPPGKCPVRVEPDPDRAVGIVIRPHTDPFFLFIPQKGPGERADDAQAHPDRAEPVGYLIGGPMGQLVVADDLVDQGRFRRTTTRLPDGRKIVQWCYPLAIAPGEGGGRVLLVFGTGEGPLLAVPLEEGGGDDPALALRRLDMAKVRVDLDLSLGKGRRAALPFGAMPKR